MPSIALIVAGVGAAISAVGAVESGQATENAANYNAQVAKNNERYASQAGISQAETASMKGANTLGQIKSSIGANSVDVNTGSAARVQAGARSGSVETATNVENNALLQAYGYKATSELDTEEAQQAPIGADIGAAGGLLESAGSIGFNWGGGGGGNVDDVINKYAGQYEGGG